MLCLWCLASASGHMRCLLRVAANCRLWACKSYKIQLISARLPTALQNKVRESAHETRCVPVLPAWEGIAGGGGGSGLWEGPGDGTKGTAPWPEGPPSGGGVGFTRGGRIPAPFDTRRRCMDGRLAKV